MGILRTVGVILLLAQVPVGSWGKQEIDYDTSMRPVAMTGQAYVIASGKITVTANGVRVGEYTTISLVPNTPMWYAAKELNGQDVELVLRTFERKK